jgi:arsenate reductase
MAEGWARRLKSGVIDARSAGIEPHGVNPLAVAAMAEVGIDIAGQRSKHVDEVAGASFDYVVTLCDDARESCPVFTGAARVVHRGFDDPPRLARDAPTEAAALEHYRRVRDEIRDFVSGLPDNLE